MSSAPSEVSRRLFLREVAAGAAVTVAAPELASAVQPATPEKPKLSAVGEAQLQALFARRGAQFTEDQKKDLHRLLVQMEQTSKTLREFPLEDNAEPAILFRVRRKEEKA
jgi:hypothetical protein